MGIKKYDDQLYFDDVGVIGDKRYVLGFKPTFFKEERINRNEKIAFFNSYLKKENKDLKMAQRDRNLEATRNLLDRLALSHVVLDPHK